MDAEAMRRDGRDLPAFHCECFGISSIVFAETAGKARATTVRAANDAGYGASFRDVKVRRAPDYDGAVEAGFGLPPRVRHCYVPSYLRTTLSPDGVGNG